MPYVAWIIAAVVVLLSLPVALFAHDFTVTEVADAGSYYGFAASS
mgnify:CR=1 FL=1